MNQSISYLYQYIYAFIQLKYNKFRQFNMHQDNKISKNTINLKNTVNSPTHHTKTAVSPRNQLSQSSKFNKNVIGGEGIKVGQWKTQKTLPFNQSNTSAQQKITKNDILTATFPKNNTKGVDNLNSPKHFTKNKKQLPEQRSKLGSPKSTLRGSTINMASKISQGDQKSAVVKTCKNCEDNQVKHTSQVQELEQKVKKIQENLTESHKQIQELKKQKKQLEYKVGKFSGILADNRKLIKQKAARFNNEGEQIKKMNQRIMELQAIVQNLQTQKEQRQKEFKQKQDQILQFQNSVLAQDFPNLQQVQSQVVSEKIYMQKFMTTLGAKFQQKNLRQIIPRKIQSMQESDIYKMLQSKATQQSTQNQILAPSQDIQQFKAIIVTLEQKSHELSQLNKSYLNKQKQLLQKIQIITRQRQHQQNKRKQLGIQNKQLLANNQMLSVKNEKLQQRNNKYQEQFSKNIDSDQKYSKNLFKKLSISTTVNDAETEDKKNMNKTYTQNTTTNATNNNKGNRSVILSKLDRIKRISERQNQIIMQIKQSSRISMSSDSSLDHSILSALTQ